MPQTCSTFAAYICGAFAANAFFVCKFLFWHTVLAHNVRRKNAAHSCRALFWHTMCAASLQCTAVAHYSGTQCAPQVCGAQLSRTILAHNVRRTGKFAAHSCRTLYWHTMCAVQVSLQRTVAAHCTGTQCAPQVCGAQLSRTILAHNVRRKFAAHSCRTLFLCATTFAAHSCRALGCSAPPHPLTPPPPQPPTPPLFYHHPHGHIFF